jgi:hypothetical protein
MFSRIWKYDDFSHRYQAKARIDCRLRAIVGIAPHKRPREMDTRQRQSVSIRSKFETKPAFSRFSSAQTRRDSHV